MLEKLLNPHPASRIPMKLVIHKSQLLELINAQLQNQGDPAVPSTCDISIHVPGGGDYSDTDIYLDDKELPITVEWKELPSKIASAPAEIQEKPYDPVEAWLKSELVHTLIGQYMKDREADKLQAELVYDYTSRIAKEED